MRKVRKAVFPVAGLGTRFLPATKASPKEMLQQMLSVTKDFTSLQKGIAMLILAVVMGGMLMLSMGGKATNYQVLFSSLSQEDAAEVVAKLKEQLIPYELDMNGTVVKVPADKVLDRSEEHTSELQSQR